MLKQNNCHLLRVDKEHFNRILRDVEANTLRLQEHGKDVLVLERVAKQRGHSAFKYVIFRIIFLFILIVTYRKDETHSSRLSSSLITSNLFILHLH